jgi:hypothetical protein
MKCVRIYQLLHGNARIESQPYQGIIPYNSHHLIRRYEIQATIKYSSSLPVDITLEIRDKISVPFPTLQNIFEPLQISNMYELIFVASFHLTDFTRLMVSLLIPQRFACSTF